MAITKIHAVKVRLGDAINYIENPDKTDGQEFLSPCLCLTSLLASTIESISICMLHSLLL